MNYDAFRQRQQRSRLSLWELGDLLGIHPHHLHFSDSSGALADQPVRILIDLARQLDMHPADLVPALEPLLDNGRAPQKHNDAAPNEPGADTDTRTVLAALATAATPLAVDELATALGWSLDRTTAAIDYAHQRPDLAGPYALRRVPPGDYTLAPRLDHLTDQQRAGLTDLANHHEPLTVDQAQALLAAINLGNMHDYSSRREDYSRRRATTQGPRPDPPPQRAPPRRGPHRRPHQPALPHRQRLTCITCHRPRQPDRRSTRLTAGPPVASSGTCDWRLGWCAIRIRPTTNRTAPLGCH